MVKSGARGPALWMRNNALGMTAIFIALGGTALATSVSSTTKVVTAPRAQIAKSRRGPRGPQGPPGPQGPQGIQGQVGPATGPAGGGLTGNYPNPTLAPPEAWHEVGSTGEPPFQNSWVNLDSSGLATAAFYKDPFGVVRLKGIVSGGTVSTAVFTLPAGYRPPKTEDFPAVSFGGTSPSIVLADVIVGDDGTVQIAVSAGNTSSGVTLDGITFRTS
jgi:hypothetical protein